MVQNSSDRTPPLWTVPLPLGFDADTAPRPWKYIVVHHSATVAGDVASIDAAHRRRTDSSGRHWKGIGYHFVVGNGNGLADGTVEATFRWREQIPGAHAGVEPFNSFGIGICLIGDFETAPPTGRQIESLAELIARLCRQFHIPPQRVLRHGELKATACPGRQFPLDDVLTIARQTGKLPADANPHDREAATDPARIPAEPAPRSPPSGATSFRPFSAQDTEGIKHVVSISRAWQRAQKERSPSPQ